MHNGLIEIKNIFLYQINYEKLPDSYLHSMHCTLSELHTQFYTRETIEQPIEQVYARQQ